jgi:PBP1b-binding outer membrane lipoprotein LpoB
MKALIVLLPLILCLNGCPATIPRVPDKVEVPIPTRCEPTTNVTQLKELDFDKAKKEMTLYEKNQLLLAENSSLTGQNTELKAALKECTK